MHKLYFAAGLGIVEHYLSIVHSFVDHAPSPPCTNANPKRLAMRPLHRFLGRPHTPSGSFAAGAVIACKSVSASHASFAAAAARHLVAASLRGLRCLGSGGRRHDALGRPTRRLEGRDDVVLDVLGAGGRCVARENLAVAGDEEFRKVPFAAQGGEPRLARAREAIEKQG